MMNYNELLSRFYQMETDEKLFEITDKNGIYVWDLVRYYVFTTLLWTGEQVNGNEGKLSLRTCVSKFFKLASSLFVLLFIHKPYYFFLNSRNKQAGTGRFFDQNAFDTLNTLLAKDCLIEEIYPTSRNDLYKDYTVFASSGIIYRFFRNTKENYNFIEIKNIIDKYFVKNKITTARLLSEYMSFFQERAYYRFVFKRVDLKMLFVTQSWVHKGLFAAAHELDIPIVEFNHGIVYNGHMLYSYPRIKEIHNYNSDYIFALSDFWFKDMYLPNTKIISVGNNYFYPKYKANNSPVTDNSILVISSSEMGLLLKDFMLNLFKQYPESSNYNFIFKLHPNQYDQLESYKKYFCEYKNVTVKTNEKSVPEFMQDCATLFAIQSTAAFEALQMGRKVILLKQLSYETMQVLFSDKNVYQVDTPADFIKAKNIPINKESREFFSPFNANKVKETIANIMKYGRA